MQSSALQKQAVLEQVAQHPVQVVLECFQRPLWAAGASDLKLECCARVPVLVGGSAWTSCKIKALQRGKEMMSTTSPCHAPCLPT